ncbi:MAG: glycerol-3-phosphate dehydrogenase [NAD(P)+] [Planctomycetota bacterium]
MISKAAVVGAGAMGTICAQILATNGASVDLLCRRRDAADEMRMTRENRRYLPGIRLPDPIRPTGDAAAALANAELVISAVPCQHLRGVWPSIGRLVEADAAICSVTKGIESNTLALPTQIIRQFAPNHAVAVLSGPTIAPEVAKCLPATVVVAGSPPVTAELVQQAMTTSWFRVYTNPDLLGVELGGALKNVIALAAGILDGLHAGDNAKAALLTRGLAEITRLAVAMGAYPETLMGLAGVGDLVTTCVSPLGRNRTAGQRIASGETIADITREGASVVEGIPTTGAALALAARLGVEMPITQAVSDVLHGRKTPLGAITELMNRPPKAEGTRP